MSVRIFLYTEANIACIVLLLLLVFFVWRGSDKHESKIMFANALMVMVFTCAGSVFWLMLQQTMRPAMIPLGYILFIFQACMMVSIGFHWFLYGESLMGASFFETRKHKFLASLPVLATHILVLTTPLTGLLIKIRNEGGIVVVEKGILHGIYYWVMFVYIIVVSAQGVIKAMREEKVIEQKMYLAIAAYPIAILVTGVIQQFFPDVPLLCYGCVFCSLLTHIVTQDSKISTDPLTKLNNRNQLNKFMLAEMRNPEINEHLYLMIFDIDKFKQINDKFGHVEGDKALVKMTDILKKAAKNQEFRNFIARFGGDEFIIVTEAWDEMQRIIKKIRALEKENNATTTDPYELSISMGYAKYEKNMSGIQQWIDTADELLYKEKKVKERERNMSMR